MSKNIGSFVNSCTAFNEHAQASRLIDSWSEEPATELQTATSRLLKEAMALAANEKAANADPNLSITGKFDRVKNYVQDFITNLRWQRDLKGALETRCGNLYGLLFVLTASTRSDQGQRDAHIWGAFGALPPEERNNGYLRASETDNVEVLRALKDAPLPLVADEIILRADDERAARLQPQRYRTFVETSELLHEISVILADALDLGVAFGIDVKPSVDELGPKVRTAVDFAIEHQGARGKKVLRT